MDDKKGFCRLAWKIGDANGNGEWFDNTPENLELLKAHAIQGNKDYGSGSHRIEHNDGEESKKLAEKAILNAQSTIKPPM